MWFISNTEHSVNRRETICLAIRSGVLFPITFRAFSDCVHQGVGSLVVFGGWMTMYRFRRIIVAGWPGLDQVIRSARSHPWPPGQEGDVPAFLQPGGQLIGRITGQRKSGVWNRGWRAGSGDVHWTGRVLRWCERTDSSFRISPGAICEYPGMTWHWAVESIFRSLELFYIHIIPDYQYKTHDEIKIISYAWHAWCGWSGLPIHLFSHLTDLFHVSIHPRHSGILPKNHMRLCRASCCIAIVRWSVDPGHLLQ